MGRCNQTIPLDMARPRTCAICGLGPCKVPDSVLQQQQRLPNQEPFKPPVSPSSATSPSDPDQRMKASLALNDELEKELLRRLKELLTRGADPRCISVARTKLQEAFMWMNRGVFNRKDEWPESHP